MPRSSMHIILLAIWLFAIVGPSVITFFSDGNKSFITINLNEEEQQEQGKKNIGEKLIVLNKNSNYSILSFLQGAIPFNFYIFKNSQHISDIVLPPPEQLA